MEFSLQNQRSFLLIVGVALILIHGLFPTFFVVDVITIAIYVILSIPFLAQYLKKAKVYGAEFEFRDEIKATEKLVDLSIQNAKESATIKPRVQAPPFTVFDLSSVNDMVATDHVLALAALRIEIEKKLRVAAIQLGFSSRKPVSTIALLQFLTRKEVLRNEQIEAIRQIQKLCNLAVHGYEVSKDDAEQIIELAEKLNESFSIGYSINFNPNPDYEEQGLMCPWQHCIEQTPLRPENSETSCPIFGHDCPGGIEQVKVCQKMNDDSDK